MCFIEICLKALAFPRRFKLLNPVKLIIWLLQSRPSESWARASDTLQVNGLEAIRLSGTVMHCEPKYRVHHHPFSSIFGRPSETRQIDRRSTPLKTNSANTQTLLR
jgi:GDP-D-mannose dehydratase